MEICLGKPLDDALLHVVHNEVQTLSHSLDDYRGKQDEDLKSVCSTLALFKAEFHKSIDSLEEKQSNLKETCQDLKCKQDEIKAEMTVKDKEQKELLRTSELHWQTRQEQVESLCKTLEVKRADMQRDLDVLKTKMNSLSFSEGAKKVVFDAPEQNKWFTGREKEIDILEKGFPLESGNGLKMAAVCGLGGCGKTTLAAHFAWKRKPEYNGGVFWVSMEDDRKFENSMNDLALRLGVLADSFDLTLSKVLNCISQQRKAWLLVVDDVDQFNLSDQMRKVLSGRWKRQATGHLLLTTRREPKEVCESIDLEPSCCMEIFSFSEEEAKKFILTRSGICDDVVQEEKLHELIQELGCLPLALEQAAAHIKALQCPISTYLEHYKSQRLKLLSQQPAKPSWEYESQSRLAVHTTWLINFEYVKNSPHGEEASSFVHAAAFLAPYEIEEELINLKILSVASPSSQSINFSIVRNQIMETLTKFSLFQRKNSRSLSLHRLVQEVIRNRMSSEEIALSLLTAIRLLHHSFQDCPSPDQILTDVAESVQGQASTSVADPSLFYLWSKLTSHASELQYHLKSLLDEQGIERDVKTMVLTRETSRVVYENAVNLSVHGHQEEAKEAERFAFQILDSGSNECVALSLDGLRELFPHTLPLPQMLQKIIFYSSQPPIENQKLGKLKNQQNADIDEIRSQGNAFFKNGRFTEAVEMYTTAIEGCRGTENLDPRLLNNRATAYLKLGKFEECLQDSENYINIMPNCWKGYSRKALALNGLGRKLPALCSAAMAYYHDASCCRHYEAFRNAFSGLEGNWKICGSSEEVLQTIIQNSNDRSRQKVVLLEAGEYYFRAPIEIVNTVLAAVSNEVEVNLNCEELCFNKECFVQNIILSVEHTVSATLGDVEFDKCLFKSTGAKQPVVTVEGAAMFRKCTIKHGGGCGVLVVGPDASATMVKCHVIGNGIMELYVAGIRVFNEGRLVLQGCHIHGNSRGIWVDEGPVGVLAKEATIMDCEVYDNKFEGILVAGLPPPFPVSLPVSVGRNKIYHNGTFGVRVMLNINDIVLENNMIFENFFWGVYVHNDSGGLYKGNEICNNKMGGIMVNKQSPGKPPCVIENNFIHDNCGPAFYEGLRFYEASYFPVELRNYLLGKNSENIFNQLLGQKTDVTASAPNMVSSDFKNNQCLRNDFGLRNLQSVNSKVHCTFCFQRDVELKSCKRCMTARYCGKKCQTLHWGKHKYICKSTVQRNAVELSLPVWTPGLLAKVKHTVSHPGLEPSGPNYASPPPRDGSRFVVKLQTTENSADPMKDFRTIELKGFVGDELNPNKATITVYDRSRHIDFTFCGNPQLYHLIMECGMMGASMSLSKKLYCWAAFKDHKTLQIFTHEFPPVQRW